MARQRRLVPVREDIIEELMGVAKRSGLSLSELVEAILSHSVKVLRGRDDVAMVLADSVVYADIARLGGAPVPLEAVLQAVDNGCNGLGEALAGLARLAALSAKARGLGVERGLLLVARALLPGIALDLVEEDGGYRLIAASPRLAGRNAAETVEAVLRSVVEGFGGKVVGAEANSGLVVVRFTVEG